MNNDGNHPHPHLTVCFLNPMENVRKVFLENFATSIDQNYPLLLKTEDLLCRHSFKTIHLFHTSNQMGSYIKDLGAP